MVGLKKERFAFDRTGTEQNILWIFSISIHMRVSIKSQAAKTISVGRVALLSWQTHLNAGNAAGKKQIKAGY